MGFAAVEAPRVEAPSIPSAFRAVPRTGVIYVTTEAIKRGFGGSCPSWCNLGQGQPETGDVEGAPPRINTVEIAEFDRDDAPVCGLTELRESVAAMYNPTASPRTGATRAGA